MPAYKLPKGVAKPSVADFAVGGVMSAPVKGLWKLMRQPKEGGVLYETLRAAAEKSGMGQAVTPGEAQLLKRYTNPILGKGLPRASAELTPAQRGALEYENPFTPWAGLKQIKSILGF